jgi:hypothetical protein
VSVVTAKAILEAALKLPPRSRARLAGKLLDSLAETDGDEALQAGARVAEQRLQGILAGKTKGIPEEEAHRLVFGKSKP